MTIRYVAIGDSFSEGVGDERPDGVPRGWADRVAERLALLGGSPVYYANLAIRGRLLPDIVAEQLPAALALDPAPTHLSFNGGGNDIMRPSYDRTVHMARIRALIEACRERGIVPVVLSGADASAHVPLGGLLRRRAVDVTTATAELCAELGCTFVDVFADPVLRRAEFWSADRVHLNPRGHARAASVVLASTGLLSPSDVEDDLPLVTSGRRTLRGEARYYREHVAPWLGRRLRGRSSGDGRPAKFGTWTAMPAGGGVVADSAGDPLPADLRAAEILPADLHRSDVPPAALRARDLRAPAASETPARETTA